MIFFVEESAWKYFTLNMPEQYELVIVLVSPLLKKEVCLIVLNVHFKSEKFFFLLYYNIILMK